MLIPNQTIIFSRNIISNQFSEVPQDMSRKPYSDNLIQVHWNLLKKNKKTRIQTRNEENFS